MTKAPIFRVEVFDEPNSNLYVHDPTGELAGQLVLPADYGLSLRRLNQNHGGGYTIGRFVLIPLRAIKTITQVEIGEVFRG